MPDIITKRKKVVFMVLKVLENVSSLNTYNNSLMRPVSASIADVLRVKVHQRLMDRVLIHASVNSSII